MAGFTSPTILHLSTWDAPERKYMSGVLERLRTAGYTAFHEPAVGGFAMPLVATDAGWQPSQIDTSDTHLYTAIIGELVAGRDMAGLNVTLDGNPIQFPDPAPLEQAAQLLYIQYLTRMQGKPEVRYWEQLTANLEENHEEHLSPFREQLRGLWSRLDGAKYSSESIWDHLDRAADDEHAVIVSNPPTYRGAYEKFFDTKDRLTWAAPQYEVFDAAVDIPRMVEVMEGRKALLLVQQQQTTGNSAHPKPVYARQLGADQLVYINSNRPEEVVKIVGGLRVVRKKLPERPKRPWPVLPSAHPVTAESHVEVVKCDGNIADAYRTEWMHRLYAGSSGESLMVMIDGYAAGVIGFSVQSIVKPYTDKWGEHAILRFAFGAKHDHLRLTRLATMLSLQHEALWKCANALSSIPTAAARGLVTVEMTRHPEAKGLRGLMKLVERQKHPDGYRLMYASDWHEPASPAEILTQFIEGEAKWLSKQK